MNFIIQLGILWKGDAAWVLGGGHSSRPCSIGLHALTGHQDAYGSECSVSSGRMMSSQLR